MEEIQYKKCMKYPSIHLRYEPYLNKIIALKCCLKFDEKEILKSWSIDEFENLDIWEELKYINNTTPKGHDESIPAICPFKDIGACKWDWNEWPLERLEIGFELHCNCHCRFCHIHPDVDKNIDVDTMNRLRNLYFKTLYSLKGHNLKKIQLTEQGEPFFFKNETFNFLKSLSPEDTKEVSAYTNFTIPTPNEIDDLYSQLKVEFTPIVSIHGWDETSYSEITGMSPSYFKKVMENIKVAVSHGAKVESIFVIDDVNNLENVYNFIKSNEDLFQNRWHLQNEILQPEIADAILDFLKNKRNEENQKNGK